MRPEWVLESHRFRTESQRFPPPRKHLYKIQVVALMALHYHYARTSSRMHHLAR